jgi:hypothetical protein
MAKAVEKVFDFLADMIAPAPPPTKDQAERMERVAEEQQTQAVAEREAAEKEARLQELLEQIKRDDAQARYSRYTGAGGSTGATPSKSAIAAAGANESVEPREAGTPGGAARSSVPPGAPVSARGIVLRDGRPACPPIAIRYVTTGRAASCLRLSVRSCVLSIMSRVLSINFFEKPEIVVPVKWTWTTSDKNWLISDVRSHS